MNQAKKRSAMPENARVAGCYLMCADFLTFKLGAEEYGVDILAVQEIRSYQQPTQIANTPDFLKGLLNMRGQLVPIVDMRMKFRSALASYSEFTVVVVLNIGCRLIGMVVDSVSDVVSFAADQLRAVPVLAATVCNQYLLALGISDDRTIMLLDGDKLIAGIEAV